ncbi:MAG: SMC-Scp complex subunit ScpB [Planctomycetaceae bacterium]
MTDDSEMPNPDLWSGSSDPAPDEPLDDIELAYREALRSLDEAEQQVGSALMELSMDMDSGDEVSETAFTSIGNELADDLEADQTENLPEPPVISETRVSPRSVIEAALFVGGEAPLTARKLASLIGNDTDTRLAVRLIDQLNADYAAEQRPYELRLHEGGFRMQLREDFADVALKVFGMGPREVRLSPEVLEVLAYVAYNQPVAAEALGDISQRNAVTLIRQLIRLKLVEVERSGRKRTEVTYHTTDRFLQLFGLESLDDLPQADVFSFK